MKTSQATILVDVKQQVHLIYSPDDGVSHCLERIFGTWSSPLWKVSDYKTPDKIDSDTPYYEVVTDTLLRQNLLLSAKEQYSHIMWKHLFQTNISR